MKKLIIANLKMNFSKDEMIEYVDEIRNKISNTLDLVICPSSVYIYMFEKAGYNIGSQNAYYLGKGPFTGEISPIQLKSLGVSHVIIGHSERRNNFDETDILIGKKLAACLKENIKPILCIGETLNQKQCRKTAEVLKNQLLVAFKDIPKDEMYDVIVAYEPVWAIGSGKIPEVKDIQDAAIFIKDVIRKKYDIEIKVLYGGSVDKSNIEKINNIMELDGLLIGSSSLNASYFVEMLDLID